jgi:hypothetical protein
MNIVTTLKERTSAFYEDGEVCYSIFASDLGLAPGSWPEFILVLDPGNSERPRMLFGSEHMIDHNNKCGEFLYRTLDGVELSVFND